VTRRGAFLLPRRRSRWGAASPEGAGGGPRECHRGRPNRITTGVIELGRGWNRRVSARISRAKSSELCRRAGVTPAKSPPAGLTGSRRSPKTGATGVCGHGTFDPKQEIESLPELGKISPGRNAPGARKPRTHETWPDSAREKRTETPRRVRATGPRGQAALPGGPTRSR